MKFIKKTGKFILSDWFATVLAIFCLAVAIATALTGCGSSEGIPLKDPVLTCGTCEWVETCEEHCEAGPEGVVSYWCEWDRELVECDHYFYGTKDTVMCIHGPDEEVRACVTTCPETTESRQ